MKQRSDQQIAPAGRVAYVNGRYLPFSRAGVHVEDRGLQFADAVYEVWGVTGGLLYDEDEHFDRLERSLRAIGIAMPMARAPFKAVLREVLRRNRVRDGLIYLQVTRGTARRDHPVPATPLQPTVILTARNVDVAALARRRADGVAVATMPDGRWARCDIKSTALLPNILAKTRARAAGAYEAWLVGPDGAVTEGSSTTAWIVDEEGRLVTRDLSNAILPGVTRRIILKAAQEAQIPVMERQFTPSEATQAREAFLSAATAAVIPVVNIDGTPIGDGTPGKLTRRIQELYAAAARAAAESRR